MNTHGKCDPREEKAKHEEFNSETLVHWKRGLFLGPPECLALVSFFILIAVERVGGGHGYSSENKREICLKHWTMICLLWKM